MACLLALVPPMPAQVIVLPGGLSNRPTVAPLPLKPVSRQRPSSPSSYPQPFPEVSPTPSPSPYPSSGISVTPRGYYVEVRSPRLAISNVVLQFADGSRQRFEDVTSGHSGSFSGTGSHAGKRISTVWVKAGANFSGDGPGYGQRFDLAQ
jgi:hypothetical protein